LPLGNYTWRASPAFLLFTLGKTLSLSVP